MKIIKKGMRVWITIASVISFLGGWALFSHAKKPAPLQFSQPAISTPSSNQFIQSFNIDPNSGGFSFPFQGQSNSFSPRLRTGGS